MINLLPPAEKSELYKTLFRKQFNSFGLLVAIILLGGAILTFNTYIFLKIQTNKLGGDLGAEEVSGQIESAEDFDDSVRAVRGLVDKYHGFETEFVSFSGVLAELQRLMPFNVSLDVFSFDAASRKVIISGQAIDREDVLALESRLKTSSLFTKLESPLSNFLEKSKPRFSFTFYLK